MKKTLVIGVGNPILGDDGLGIHAVRQIYEEYKNCKVLENVFFKEISAGGLGILENILDFEKVIMIDAVITGKYKVGKVLKMRIEDFSNTLHSTSPHDVNLATAFEIGKRSMPERMPKEVVIYGVEVSKDNIQKFSEELSPEIKESIKEIVECVKKEIE